MQFSQFYACLLLLKIFFQFLIKFHINVRNSDKNLVRSWICSHLNGQEINHSYSQMESKKYQKVSQILKCPIQSFKFLLKNKGHIQLENNKKISDYSFLTNGVQLYLELQKQIIEIWKQRREDQKKQIQKLKNQQIKHCNHGKGGKCLNCMDSSQKDKAMKIEKVQKILLGNTQLIVHKKCNHPKNGKCINCMNNKNQIEKKKCNHGPKGKCANCVGGSFQQHYKITFKQFLKILQQRCKKHKSGQKCNRCLPPQSIRYSINTRCNGQHLPYPQAMCNRCMPPVLTIQHQQYTHVDQIVFTNDLQLTNFLNYCEQNKTTRLAFLYGRYEFEGDKCVGIIMSLYEPVQQEIIQDIQYFEDQQTSLYLDRVSQALCLKRIGILYIQKSATEITSNKMMMIANLQEMYKQLDQTGHFISRFISIVITKDLEYQFPRLQVFMVSDQFQALNNNNLIIPFDINNFSLKTSKQKHQQTMPTYLINGIEIDKSSNSPFIVYVIKFYRFLFKAIQNIGLLYIQIIYFQFRIETKFKNNLFKFFQGKKKMNLFS